MKRDLNALFFPCSVGIVGVSSRQDAWGTIAYEAITRGGYGGAVLAIAPRSARSAVRGVNDLASAGRIDLLVVAVPTAAALDVVAEAAAADVGAVIVFTDGFAETGEDGVRRQRKLVEAAGSLPILGPNCLGIVNVPGRLHLAVSAFAARQHKAGPVALISQSGALGFVLADLLGRRGIGFNFYVSTGNEANLGATDTACYLLEREDVRIIGIYLETVRDIAGFREMARSARSKDKHVVILKVGRTGEARAAATSHTAAVVGGWDAFAALCREEGVVLVDSDESFVEAVHVLRKPGRLSARLRLAVVSNSGGAGALLADRLAGVAELPELSAKTQESLHSLPTPVTSVRNPVDLTGRLAGHVDHLDLLLDTVSSDDSVDGTVVFLSFGDRQVERFRSFARDAIGSWPRGGAGHRWLVWAGAPEGEVEDLADLGSVFPSISSFVRGLKAYPREMDADHAARAVEASQQPLVRSPDTASMPKGYQVITERHGARILAKLGMPYVKLLEGKDAEMLQAGLAEEEMVAPWVLKVDHPAVPHRASRGLLVAGLEDAVDLTRAAKLLLDRCAELQLEPAPTLVLETQVQSKGELALGMLRDPVVGPVVVVGPGGDRAEEKGASRSLATCPVDDRKAAFLFGSALQFAGGGTISEGDFAKAIASLSALAETFPEIQEADVNPVLVLHDGSLLAVDCLLVRSGNAL